MNAPLTIAVDDREVKSGIVADLEQFDWEVRVCRLPVGDYRLGRDAVVERKTARDLAVSIVDGRLFRQAAQFKNLGIRSAFLIEGDPFCTDVSIDPEAVRGAIVSVSLTWQVPMVFSESRCQTVELLWYMANQVHRLTTLPSARYGYRPKRLVLRQLYILQGFTGVGPKRAAGLMKRFGTLRRIFQATEKEWIEAEGIGKKGARQMAALLDAKFAVEE
jgi:Fanconi anemia group M protein